MKTPKIEQSEILRVAREYVGTPFHVGGRVKGVGVDCAGLVSCVLGDLGAPTAEIDKLSHHQGDLYQALCAKLSEICDKVTIDEIQDGDVLVIHTKHIDNHCGFVFPSQCSWIHAIDSPAFPKVVEQPISQKWLDRVTDVFRYRGAH